MSSDRSRATRTRPAASASSSATSTGRTRTFASPSSSTARSRTSSGRAATSTSSATTTARVLPRRRSRRSARPSTRRPRASGARLDAGSRPCRARARVRPRSLRGDRRRPGRLHTPAAAGRLRAQRALRLLRLLRRRGDRAAECVPDSRLLVRLRRRALEQGAAVPLRLHGFLGRPGRLAAALALGPDGGRLRRGRVQPSPDHRGAAVDGPGARRGRELLRAAARLRRQPVRDPGRAGRRRRAQPEPAEPVHDDPPAAALPRLRRVDDPLRLRRRRAALRAVRRTVDRRHAPLVTGAFCLSTFGTFLTRSGLINSIHSFAQSPIGAWFLGFIALAATFSTVLILWRLPLLRARTKLESLASREAAFLYNNLLLVAFTLTVLWGVAFPLLSDAVRGEAVTVGPPYYDFFLKVFGLPLLLLMGIGPLVAWRRTSLRALGETVLGPALAALAVGVILIALGAGSSTAGLLAYTFSAFALAAIVLEFARGTRARKALGASSWWSAFSSLVARNRRRYGGFVVHLSIVPLSRGTAGPTRPPAPTLPQ